MLVEQLQIGFYVLSQGISALAPMDRATPVQIPSHEIVASNPSHMIDTEVAFPRKTSAVQVEHLQQTEELELVNYTQDGQRQVLEKLIGQQVTFIYAQRLPGSGSDEVKYYHFSTQALVRSGNGLTIDNILANSVQGYYGVIIVGTYDDQQLTQILSQMNPTEGPESSLKLIQKLFLQPQGQDLLYMSIVREDNQFKDKASKDPQIGSIYSGGSAKSQDALATSLSQNHSFVYPPKTGNRIRKSEVVLVKEVPGKKQMEWKDDDIVQTVFSDVTIVPMPLDGYVVGVLPGTTHIVAYLDLDTHGKPFWTKTKPSAPTIKFFKDNVEQNTQDNLSVPFDANSLISNVILLGIFAGVAGVSLRFAWGRLMQVGVSSGSTDSNPATRSSSVSAPVASPVKSPTATVPEIHTRLDRLGFRRTPHLSNAEKTIVRDAIRAGAAPAIAKMMHDPDLSARGLRTAKHSSPDVQRKTAVEYIRTVASRDISRE